MMLLCFIGQFSSLYEKYSGLLNDGIATLKEILIQLDMDNLFPPHPKLTELVRVMCKWKKETRKSCREKVKVLVVTRYELRYIHKRKFFF